MTGAYRYATVIQLLEYDPVNDVDPGQVYLVAGKHEDGYERTVIDEDTDGFLDLDCEAVGVVGPADFPMSESEIRSWATEQDEALDLAESAVERFEEVAA